MPHLPFRLHPSLVARGQRALVLQGQGQGLLFLGLVEVGVGKLLQ